MLNRIQEEWTNSAAGSSTTATRAAQSIPESGTDWGQLAQTWLGRVEKLVSTHPGWSMAAGVAAGAFLGWWVKRK